MTSASVSKLRRAPARQQQDVHAEREDPPHHRQVEIAKLMRTSGIAPADQDPRGRRESNARHAELDRGQHDQRRAEACSTSDRQAQPQEHAAHAHQVARHEVVVREQDALGQQADEARRHLHHHQRERQRRLRVQRRRNVVERRTTAAAARRRGPRARRSSDTGRRSCRSSRSSSACRVRRRAAPGSARTPSARRAPAG